MSINPSAAETVAPSDSSNTNPPEQPKPPKPACRASAVQTAFGCPRDPLENRFVYVVISPRARGLSVGVNMNPDKYCNFDCGYCEVDRRSKPHVTRLDPAIMAQELRNTLDLVHSGGLGLRPRYQNLPQELLRLRHVSLSGDGEPTLCPNFAEAIEMAVHVRALAGMPFFKVVLITNGTGLQLPEVQRGLKQFTDHDEIWTKFDAGTQEYMDRVNRSSVSLESVMENILSVAKHRPVVIQSLFPALNGMEPDPLEIEQYALRLRELTDSGAKISLVQVYSATRPTPRPDCGHLPLKVLSRIAHTVRATTGLRAEVF